ncbi:UNVERIFIED_CONTAM: hypothetical protein Sangu_1441000 [Sesamum angustifolium]|uniref:Uncharacterized protein n=1 Tax=Sesamum angustifolium TaxID=2727405 RepID=A0AAW2N8J1_9LAMI
MSKNVKGSENLIHSQDEESMELYSRATAQEKEILYLKERIALASVKESQLLKEKYTLERKSAELRMAVESERLIFMSSMLEILGEYGAWPHVTNASALSNSIKVLGQCSAHYLVPSKLLISSSLWDVGVIVIIFSWIWIVAD